MGKTQQEMTDSREETDEEQRIAQAAIGGWMNAMVGWNETQDDAIRLLTEQVEKLTIQMAQLMMVMQNELS